MSIINRRILAICTVACIIFLIFFLDTKKHLHQESNITKIDSSMTVFHMDGGIYPASIDVIITVDKRDVYNYFALNGIDSTLTEDYVNSCDGITSSDGLNFTVWLESAKLNPENISTVQHELFHVLRVIMDEAGIPLNEYTNEAYAYELGYLTKEFYKKLKH